MTARFLTVCASMIPGALVCLALARDPKASEDGGGECEDMMGNECRPTETEYGCYETLCGPLEEFDSAGCPRVPCTSDDECASDESCYFADEHGGCNSSLIRCSIDETDGCDCAGNNDCHGRYCVATADLPG